MTTTPPTHVEALIIGGGYAGLLAASVIARAGYDVLVLDGDPRTAHPREGDREPARHGAILQVGGTGDVSDLAHGAAAMLRHRGARTFPLSGDGHPPSRTHPQAREPGEAGEVGEVLELLTCSRGLLTGVLREVVLAHPARERSTTILEGARAVGLIGDESAVLGARVRLRDGTEQEITAQLVVDASGANGSGADDSGTGGSGTDDSGPTWLRELGVAPVPVATGGTAGSRATRLYRAPDGQEDVPLTAAADGARGAVLVPVEDGMWAITQTAPDRAVFTGADSFAEAALALSDPGVGRLFTEAEPAGDVVVSAAPALRRHRYESVRTPRGIVVIGDALATFGPHDARGTLAAEAAAGALYEALGRGISDPTAARRAQQAIARAIAPLWCDPHEDDRGSRAAAAPYPQATTGLRVAGSRGEEPSMHLSTPLDLRNGSRIPNRIAKAAMEESLALQPGQLPGPEMDELYRTWARGGSGLIITGNVMVDRRALTSAGTLVLDAGTDLAPFRSWAAAAGSEGGQVWMQINHPGRQVRSDLPGIAWAPSDIGVSLGKHTSVFARPTAMTEADIRATIGRFATTARLAQESGFHGVQIHAAHGYLLSQFLSPLVNRRTDRWGGSLENRARLLLDVVRAVRAAVSADFAVSIKINTADFQRGGFDVDEVEQVLAFLEDLDVDLVELSGGSMESAATMGHTADDRTLDREAYFLAIAERLVASAPMPLMLTGGVARRASAERVLASGFAAVGLATALALRPDLPARWLAGEDVEVAVPRLDWRDKSIASAGVLAVVRTHLSRISRGRPPRTRTSAVLALVLDALRTRGKTRAYGQWLARNPAPEASTPLGG